MGRKKKAKKKAQRGRTLQHGAAKRRLNDHPKKAPVLPVTRIDVDPGECWDLLEVSNSLRGLEAQLQPMLAERQRLENILENRMAKVLEAHGAAMDGKPWTLTRTDAGVYLQPYDPKRGPNGGKKKP